MWSFCFGHFVDYKFNDILKFNDIYPSGSLLGRTPVYSSLHAVSVLKEQENPACYTP